MNKIFYDLFNNIDEGIIILNAELKVCIWNKVMEHITGDKQETVINKNIFELLPVLDSVYFNKTIKNVIKDGRKMFYSAAMHSEFFHNEQKFNLKLSRIEKDGYIYLLFEFIDVTNQFLQLNQLNDYTNKLNKLNNELIDKEKTIENLAYFDSLTGVANRALFYKLSEKFLDDAKRNYYLLGVIFVNVDNFIETNYTYGHEIGDKILIKVADILGKSIRKNDIIARIGGNEFIILLTHIKSVTNYNVIVSRINNNNMTIKSNNNEIDIKLRIGASFYPDDGNNIDELIKKAHLLIK